MKKYIPTPTPLFDLKLISEAKSTDIFQFECQYCKNPFNATKRNYMDSQHMSGNTFLLFCSHKCHGQSKSKKVTVKCANCETFIIRKQSELRKIKKTNSFCSRSCAATYNNLHKTTGNRRSKLEIWLEEKLPILYPDLKFLFNDKTTINSELDIYIPSLKLAFELNGIYHYEPIHGQDKFNKIQNNDNRKFQACIEHNIELCIIDTSQMKYFKELNCLKYLDIITNIINQVAEDGGPDPQPI